MHIFPNPVTNIGIGLAIVVKQLNKYIILLRVNIDD